jgi:hypothetical protein
MGTITLGLGTQLAFADAAANTAATLRMAGILTGGTMPSTAPAFATMNNYISTGDYFDAAMTAINTPYFAAYLPRRMAKEMMSPQLTTAGIPDNDATTAIVANLIGSGTTANISKLWSDNATYEISLNGTPTHVMSLTPAQLAAVNWSTQIVRVPGQTALAEPVGNASPTPITIPAKHVGGYLTLSDRPNDNSIAQFGFTAGTNLRGIEAVYEVSMGLTLAEMVVPTGVSAQLAPNFVPEQDPNFFVGTGQPACLSCHGGGASNLTHGYATVANMFDYTSNGFTFIAAPTTGTMKSLGSNANTRTQVQTCNLSQFTTCNPDSNGIDPNQAWDLTTWQQGGLLTQMGWQGAVTGEGLNSLGTAVGQAALTYQFMVERVVSEVCPLGSISAATQATIAQQAQAKDSYTFMVASVASDPNCR